MADVPNVSGVPAVAFASNAVLSLATGDAAGVASLFGGSAWGIFSGGSPVITADTVASMEYRQEWAISDYPLEQGAFESYDKVASPFGTRVSFVAGGSEASRQALIGSVAAISGDLNLYDVATPTQTYSSVNVVHYDYRRTTQNGVGMLVVDVWLSEIRVTVGTSSTASTASPSGADAQNGGTVQSTDGSGVPLPPDRPSDIGGDVPLPPERPADFGSGQGVPATAPVVTGQSFA